MGSGSLNIDTALQSTRRLYVDTAPLIYWIEEHSDYITKMDRIIHVIETSPLQAVTSVLTLTEVMVQPLKRDNTDLAQEYQNILVSRDDYTLLSVTAELAISAGAIRARYSLRTPDAIHVASALATDCDAILTNDSDLRRVEDLNVLVLDDIEL